VHELALTQSVVESISERLREQLPEARVVRVRLQVGRLVAVVPDALRFCFDVCAQGTPLEGAALEIDEVPARGRCHDCGRETELDGLVALCACGGVDLEILSGRELHIKQVEVG
jgi:hydrogenase nickel incorporation protein HypA/HybF